MYASAAISKGCISEITDTVVLSKILIGINSDVLTCITNDKKIATIVNIFIKN